MSTFLSGYVQSLYNVENSINDDYRNCFNSLLFNWDNIGSTLGFKNDTSSNYLQRYKVAKKSLWGIINYSGELLANKSEEYVELLKCSNWYCNYDIEMLYYKFKESSTSSNILLEAILTLTSVLDRSLGNVILLKDNEVPFLMKDLLMSQTLQDMLGSTPVLFMQLLMGNVLGLNVRNIAWHGFFSENEIKPNLVAIFFILIPSLGNILQSKGYILEEIPRRPKLNIHTQAAMLKPFNLNLKEYSTNFEELVKSCTHISKSQWNFWLYAYKLYKEECYGNAVLIILPLMEHMLRSVYCEVNKCLPKKMTAESSEFYITLDVILESNYEETENKLIYVLGENILKMLLDLFTYQRGLRLRDRLSHFEIDINDVTEEISNHTITLCICIIYQLLPETPNVDSRMQFLKKIPEQYEPLFHPTSLLRKQIYNLLNKINEWTNLPRPIEFKHFVLWNNNTNFKFIEMLLTMLMRTESRSFDEFLQETVIITQQIKYPSLYRPSKEIEIIHLFQRINTAMEEIHTNVLANLNLRYNLWNSRQLRSRQRETYGRMLEYVYIVQVFLVCILYLQLKIIQQFADINEIKLSIFIKYFKSYLKYVENVKTLTQKDKNKWEEVKNLTNKCCSFCTDMIRKEMKTFTFFV